MKRNSMQRLSVRLFLGISFVLGIFLAACDDPGLADLVAEMAVEWAEGKQLISRDAQGDISPNYSQIAVYQGERWWSGSTDDPQLDAALDVAPIAMSIREADALAAEGMQNRDPARLDEAIAARPHDWNYHDQKAAILAANGDAQGAVDAFGSSEQLVEARISDGGSCRGLYQNMLRGRRDAIQAQLSGDPENGALQAALETAETQLARLNANEPGNYCAGRQ